VNVGGEAEPQRESKSRGGSAGCNADVVRQPLFGYRKTGEETRDRFVYISAGTLCVHLRRTALNGRYKIAVPACGRDAPTAPEDTQTHAHARFRLTKAMNPM
jgi:hypothetical protein